MTKSVSLKKDLIGATIIGFFAAALSLIVIFNLELKLASWIPFMVFPFLTITGILFANFIRPKVPVLYKFVKFGEAGGLNWLVDFGVLNLLILLTGVAGGVMFSVFKGISFIVATANSYGWNKLWVFESTSKDTGKELSRFLIITVLGMGINVALASVIVFTGPGLAELTPALWANIAAGIGSLIAMAWNFVMYKFWVFDEK